MCLRCDNPAWTEEDYLDHMAGLMNRYGWAVVGVEPEGTTPPLAYTAGLTIMAKPELVVTGLPLELTTPFLNSVAHDLAYHDVTWAPGDVVELDRTLKVEIVEMPHPDAHLNVAIALCGPDVRAWQVVVPDDRGRYPWSADYNAGTWIQPVLGPRARRR
jgi:hypothetical protein